MKENKRIVHKTVREGITFGSALAIVIPTPLCSLSFGQYSTEY